MKETKSALSVDREFVETETIRAAAKQYADQDGYLLPEQAFADGAHFWRSRSTTQPDPSLEAIREAGKKYQDEFGHTLQMTAFVAGAQWALRTRPDSAAEFGRGYICGMNRAKAIAREERQMRERLCADAIDDLARESNRYRSFGADAVEQAIGNDPVPTRQVEEPSK